MTPKSLIELQKDETLRKRLAKFMAQQCFRNSELENFHAGISPFSKTGDFSDVKVVSARPDISWVNLSRLSDAEMKLIMIDVVNHTYLFLSALIDDKTGDTIVAALKEHDMVPQWNDPESRTTKIDE